MISTCFFTVPSKLTAQLVTISFTMLAHLPFSPVFTSDSAYVRGGCHGQAPRQRAMRERCRETAPCRASRWR
jgi:hypothetical protein